MKNVSMAELELFEQNKMSYLKYFVFNISNDDKLSMNISDVKMLGGDQILFEFDNGKIILAEEPEILYSKNGHFALSMSLSENGDDVGFLFFLLPKSDFDLKNEVFYYCMLIPELDIIYHNISNLDDVDEVPEIIEYCIDHNKTFKNGGKLLPDMGKQKIAKVMHEFKYGKLRTVNGHIVKNRKQAIAIAMSEAGISNKRGFKIGGKVKVYKRTYYGTIKNIDKSIITLVYPEINDFEEKIDIDKIKIEAY